MIEIAPSILSADFTCLGEEIAAVERGGASLIHIDVMDGRFVPNITVGPLIVEAARRATNLPLDVHLMIIEPDRYIEDFASAGASFISVHTEAAVHLNRTLNAIRALGCKAGAVINPGTPLSSVEEVLGDVDFILVMTVNPGFGGQKFINSSLNKVRRLRKMIIDHGVPVRIEVDGGISASNVARLVECGAEIIVAGSAIFGQKDKAEAVRKMLEAARAPNFI